MDTNRLYQAIGLMNENGTCSRNKERKIKQIEAFLQHVRKAVQRLSTHRRLVLIDCACGKAYLSFLANHYLTHIDGRDVRFLCIDRNPQVLETARKTAESLGFRNMEFLSSDISQAETDGDADIVYCLHACDAATDMTVAMGIRTDAKFILSVACCQTWVRREIRKHPLTPLTRHGVYKERFADMLMDAFRGLILEANGYGVRIFEFIPTSETPKNVMLRAERVSGISSRRQEKTKQEYMELKSLFHVRSRVEDYLQIW